MKVTAYFVLLMLFVVPVLQAQAQTSPDQPVYEVSPTSPSCGLCEKAESPSFGTSFYGKLGRGLTNVLLGWTNLFSKPIQAARADENVFSGIGSGFQYLFTRTVQGVVEVGLFWIPPAYEEPLKSCALGDLSITGR